MQAISTEPRFIHTNFFRSCKSLDFVAIDLKKESWPRFPSPEPESEPPHGKTVTTVTAVHAVGAVSISSGPPLAEASAEEIEQDYQ